MKEIINKVELIQLIKETVNEVIDTVGYTYGPNGRTVILSDFEGNGIVTKDGVSVSDSIHFSNPYKNIIANILKEVARKTVEEAGDGTTTSLILTQAFVNIGYELLDNGVQYSSIKKSLEDLLKYTIIELDKVSTKTKTKDIINIARTASNNDEDISKIIDKAYRHSKVVKAEESTLSEDQLIKINGMTLRATYFDQAFINDNSTRSIKYDKCYVALIDGEMYHTDPILKLVNKLDGIPLIILADNFTDRIVDTFKRIYNNDTINVALIKTPGVNNHRRNILSDIDAYTGGTLMSPDKEYSNISYLGVLSGIEIKSNETILYNEIKLQPVVTRINELKELIKSDLPKYDKELIQQRLDSLEGKASVIRVGGKSQVEIKEKFDRYEDAILSVKHALDGGYVKGGGLTLKNIASDSNFTRTPILELSQALNACNDKLNIETVNELVIDPLKVVKSALENAISVAKTILGTEAIVLNKYLWKE